MMRIVVYGYGQLYKRYKDKIENCEIVAIADKNSSNLLSDEQTIPLILPERMNEFDYDYVAISSTSRFEEIKQQIIGENGVAEEKIISMFLFIAGKDYYDEEASYKLQTLMFNLSGKRAAICETYAELRSKIQTGEHFVYVKCTYPTREEIECLQKAKTVKRYACKGQLMYRVNYEMERKDNSDTTVFVVTHKPYEVPNNALYKPIAVGNYEMNGVYTDKTGDSIAYLNDKINECTALYWIWKNSKADIVGINHYRRYFYNNDFKCRENMTEEIAIKSYLNHADMIVYRATVPNNWTLGYEIEQSLDADVYSQGLAKLKEMMKKYQSDYCVTLERVWSMHECCYCNMLIARKEVYDAYCEWLFSFLIPTAEAMDTSELDDYNKRIVGFLAERMLTVWIEHNHFKVKILPIYVP